MEAETILEMEKSTQSNFRLGKVLEDLTIKFSTPLKAKSKSDKNLHQTQP